jgi:hypothetical protein
VTQAGAAADRARTELDCQVVGVVERADLSSQTYEVEGCGKRVRYTCTVARGSLHPVCVPELPPQIEATTIGAR